MESAQMPPLTSHWRRSSAGTLQRPKLQISVEIAVAETSGRARRIKLKSRSPSKTAPLIRMAPSIPMRAKEDCAKEVAFDDTFDGREIAANGVESETDALAQKALGATAFHGIGDRPPTLAPESLRSSALAFIAIDRRAVDRF